MTKDAGLRETQEWFLDAVMHPPGDLSHPRRSADGALKRAVAAVVTPSSRQSPEDRLAVYSRSYLARLVECLGDAFPALKRALGEPLFDAFAADYLDRHPSRSYTLCDLGDRFCDYLKETRPGDTPEGGWPDLLIDLASLEWTVNQVFDGPGIEGQRTLAPDDLLGIAPAELPKIRLQTAPCLRLLSLRFPINDYYTALRGPEGVFPTPPSPAASFMAITRRDFVVRRHVLSLVQFELLSQLQSGATLEAAIMRAAEGCELDDAELSTHLHEWFRLWSRYEFFEALTASS